MCVWVFDWIKILLTQRSLTSLITFYTRFKVKKKHNFSDSSSFHRFSINFFFLFLLLPLYLWEFLLFLFLLGIGLFYLFCSVCLLLFYMWKSLRASEWIPECLNYAKLFTSKKKKKNSNKQQTQQKYSIKKLYYLWQQKQKKKKSGQTVMIISYLWLGWMQRRKKQANICYYFKLNNQIIF